MQFGPVVRAYLGYLLRNEQVVDDRASRREISAAYSPAETQIASVRFGRWLLCESHAKLKPNIISRSSRLLREMNCDCYLSIHASLSNTPRSGEVVQTKFGYLGVVRSGDSFYIFRPT